MRIDFGRYRFEPGLVPSLAMLAVVALTISLGNWQTGRAEEKLQLQRNPDEPAINVPARKINSSGLSQRKMKAAGQFLSDATIYVDNRVYKGVPGYHVVTPLIIDDGYSRIALLVNRGWVAAGPSRQNLPKIVLPEGRIEIEGIGTVPLSRPYSLSDEVTTGPLQETLRIERIAEYLKMEVQPMVLLQTTVTTDGLIRDWPAPSSGADVNRAYAFQWYVMALVAFAIWLKLNIRRKEPVT